MERKPKIHQKRKGTNLSAMDVGSPPIGKSIPPHKDADNT